ncbi:hypothetical protein HPB49_010213 [Dermacentor silvarum]|uniref:Uncharacterized protein n=1 Tax=Dermacentor silvarum TaxID=543639 RepID=A0ACB8DYK0_DERSI|nr:hypothetical protein HPB49_010213 [Dermacentor silvarum]
METPRRGVEQFVGIRSVNEAPSHWGRRGKRLSEPFIRHGVRSGRRSLSLMANKPDARFAGVPGLPTAIELRLRRPRTQRVRLSEKRVSCKVQDLGVHTRITSALPKGKNKGTLRNREQPIASADDLADHPKPSEPPACGGVQGDHPTGPRREKRQRFVPFVAPLQPQVTDDDLPPREYTVLYRPVARRSHFLAASGDAIAAFLSGVPGAHRVRPNLRRNVVAVDTLPEDLTALLAVRVICDVRVRAKALILNTCTGTLFDVDPTFDGATIFEGLESSVPVVAIARSGDVVTLRFAGDVVPEEVLLFRRRRAVRPRLPRPLQCGRCGLFGHATVTCSRDPRCLQCAGRHPTNSCTVDRRRCLHCGGPHAAMEPRCPQWQLERRVAATLTSSKPRITRKQALELARSSGTAVIDSSKQRPAGQLAMESRPLSSRRQPGLSYSAALTGGTQADSSISGGVGEPPVTDNNPVQPPERRRRLQAWPPPTRQRVTCVWRHWQCMTPWFSMASTPREQRPRIVQWNVRSMRCRHPELAGGALIDGNVRARGGAQPAGFVAYHSATSCQQASCTASPCVDPSHPAGRSRASLYVLAGLAQAEVNVCDLPCANVECVAVTVRVGATDTCVASVYVRGRGLLDSVLRAGLLIANTGAVTFVRRGCAGSAIDLMLVSDRCHYAWRRNPDTGGVGPLPHLPRASRHRRPPDEVLQCCELAAFPGTVCCSASLGVRPFSAHRRVCARGHDALCGAGWNTRTAQSRAHRQAGALDCLQTTAWTPSAAAMHGSAAVRAGPACAARLTTRARARARGASWVRVLRPRVPRCPALSIALAELLAATFCPPTAASTRPTGILQPHHHPRRELMAPQRYFPAAGTLEEISALCTADFTIGELRMVLASRRRPLGTRLRRPTSSTTCWTLTTPSGDRGVIPEEWSEAVVVPLLKNGKPPRDPASYRPGVADVCRGQVDRSGSRHPGCRAERVPPSPSSADSLADVVTTLEEAKHRGDASYLVLLDVMSAFDQLPHATILDALCAMGVSGRLLAYAGAFLSGRTMRVRVGGALSQPRASILDAVDEYVRGIGLTLSAAKTEAMLVHPRYGAHRSAPIRGSKQPMSEVEACVTLLTSAWGARCVRKAMAENVSASAPIQGPRVSEGQWETVLAFMEQHLQLALRSSELGPGFTLVDRRRLWQPVVKTIDRWQDWWRKQEVYEARRDATAIAQEQRSTGMGRAPGFRGRVLQLTGTGRFRGVTYLPSQEIEHTRSRVRVHESRVRATRKALLALFQRRCDETPGRILRAERPLRQYHGLLNGADLEFAIILLQYPVRPPRGQRPRRVDTLTTLSLQCARSLELGDEMLQVLRRTAQSTTRLAVAAENTAAAQVGILEKVRSLALVIAGHL